ncbi:MAG: ATP-binding cassette domain-containing protein [Kofleriaceae bacterium]
MIQFDAVSKKFRDAYAVREVSFEIAAGELVCVLGESGSGKTTLVKMVNRLYDPDEGRVIVDGADIAKVDAVQLRRTIGYVIQHVGLLPHLTIADNVAMVPRLLGWTPDQTAPRVAELLELVGLANTAERFPDQLSGGQRQRIGLARALAAKPKLMLLDEPFGALDPITRTQLQGELRRIHNELKLTTVMVTHDLLEAMTLADRIAVMYRSKLVQIGTPSELVKSPADDYVAKLMTMAKDQATQLAGVVAAEPFRGTL